MSIVREERVRAARKLPNHPSPKTRRYTRRRRTPWAWRALLIFAIAIGLLLIASLWTSRDDRPIPGKESLPGAPSSATTAAPSDAHQIPQAPASSTIASGSVADPATAIVALDAMEIGEGYDAPSYDRDLFGQRWADVDRNGCDTRNDMLARDLTDTTFKPGTRDCKVLSGTLTDPYSGASITFVNGPETSPRVQIDHIVALAWAWRQGAHAWSPEQRELFANDPRNLRASGEATNQAKSDSGPSRWLPPAPELQCRFVLEWVSVVVDYNLTINIDDRDAARHVLASCAAA